MRLGVLAVAFALGSFVTERVAFAEDSPPKPTIHLRAAGEVGILWLARRYDGTLRDPARSLGGVVESNATRLGRAEMLRATAGVGLGQAAVGLEFEQAWGHMPRRPGLLGEAGTSLDPKVLRRAWSLSGEARRNHLVLGLGLGLVTTVERAGAANLLLCCDEDERRARRFVQSTYLLSFSAGYRSALIADTLFWDVRGRASVAGFNPFPLFWLLLPGWAGPIGLHEWVDGTSLGVELGLSFH
jgi:hypothetical protein